MNDIVNEPQPDVSLGLLAERINDLEDKFELEQKSFLTRMGKWAGIVALIITTIVGGLEIYDRTVVSKKEKAIAQQATVARIATKFKDYNTKVYTLRAEEKWSELTAVGSIIGLEKYNLLQELQKISPKVLQDTNNTDLVVFSNEYTIVGQTDKAIDMAKLALKNSKDSVERAAAYSRFGVAYLLPGLSHDVDKGRKYFEKAVVEAKRINNFTEDQILISHFSDWASREASLGNCEYANARFADYVGVASEMARKQNIPFDENIARKIIFFNSQCES